MARTWIGMWKMVIASIVIVGNAAGAQQRDTRNEEPAQAPPPVQPRGERMIDGTIVRRADGTLAAFDRTLRESLVLVKNPDASITYACLHASEIADTHALAGRQQQRLSTSTLEEK